MTLQEAIESLKSHSDFVENAIEKETTLYILLNAIISGDLISKEQIIKKSKDIALKMLNAEILDLDEEFPATTHDFMEIPGVDDAKKLGAILPSEEKYHWYSDIRNDQIMDAQIEILRLALIKALTEYK